MKNCEFFSHSVSQIVTSETGSTGLYLVATAQQAESIMKAVGSAANRYGTRYKTKSYLVIDKETIKRLVVVSIIKAGRAKLKRGKKPKRRKP